MRVLLTIPHFWQHDNSTFYGSRRTPREQRVEAVRSCLASIRQNLGTSNYAANLTRPQHHIANAFTSASLDIVLCVHEGNHLLDSIGAMADVQRHAFRGDPMHLGYSCHAILKEHLGQYDIYAYVEDDLLIRDGWWFSKLEWFSSIAGTDALLQPNRFEVSRDDMKTKVYIDGPLSASRTRRYQDVRVATAVQGRFLGRLITFRRTLNPHAGCFFLTDEQMARWASAPYFLDHDGSFFSTLEGAATVGVTRTFRVYKPALETAAFLEVEHFGDAWMKKIASRDTRLGVMPAWMDRARKASVDTKPAHFESGAVGWAIDYSGDAFHTGGKRLLGRQVAGKEFLDALIRHGSPETLFCLTSSERAFCSFANRTNVGASGRKSARWIPHERLAELSEPGCLFHPSPDIATLAWQRRAIGQRNHCLVGVAHTTCSMQAMDIIGDLCTAPVQPWDAVVCTSRGVKETIDHVLEQWCEYLRMRIGGNPRCPAKLPIIPLGVDCDRFAKLRADGAVRTRIRAVWRIGQDEVVFLYVGRLSFHAKANPLPMFRALQSAAHRTGRRVRLLLMGWFANKTIEHSFRRSCAEYCPHVIVAYRDGRKQTELEKAWQIADVFTLIADNIQETFGLAPVEAMAAGLPVVVTDWNGFRDTVRDQVDGFRIITTMPYGNGSLLMDRYYNGVDSYDRYVAATSQAVSVDLDQLVVAYVNLIEHEHLRKRMGEAGQQRARERFDWPVVVAEYERLLIELSAERTTAVENAPLTSKRAANPLRDDPFRVFHSYATYALNRDTRLCQGMYASSHVPAMLSEPLAAPCPHLLAARNEIVAALEALTTPRTADELMKGPLRQLPEERAIRTLAWMAKVGLARVRHQTVDLSV